MIQFGKCTFCEYPVCYSLIPVPFRDELQPVCRLCVRRLVQYACFEEMFPACDV